MVQALNLELHVGAVRKSIQPSSLKFPVGAHKLEVVL